jgi:RHS repeat-associated protein
VLTSDDGTNRTYYVVGSDVAGQAVNGLAPTYYLYDGHGSVRQDADASGSVLQPYHYDAYGNAEGFTPDDGLYYTGEMYDADLGQYYLRARWYDPANGLFNRVDPYSGNMQDPQSLHKYAYCHNNPVNGIDPSGNFRIPTSLIKFFKYYGALQGLKILTGIQATYLIGTDYQQEVNREAKVNKWISTMQELPPEQWIKEFLLRPDIVDDKNLWVFEIKPDNENSIRLGKTQLAGYVLALAARHNRLYYPGEWPPTPKIYSFSGLYGMSFGSMFQIRVRNAGNGIIAYGLFPSEEAIVTAAAMVELSFKIPQIYAGIQAGIQARAGLQPAFSMVGL